MVRRVKAKVSEAEKAYMNGGYYDSRGVSKHWTEALPSKALCINACSNNGGRLGCEGTLVGLMAQDNLDRLGAKGALLHDDASGEAIKRSLSTSLFPRR